MMRSPGFFAHYDQEPVLGTKSSQGQFQFDVFLVMIISRNHNARIAIPSVSTSVVLEASATRWTGP